MGWLDDYEAPHFRTKTPFNWKPWLFWFVIVILIVGVGYYFLTKTTPIVATQTVTETVSQPPADVAKPVFKSEVPPFDTHCTVVAGVIPGSIERVGNKVTFTFKNNGKVNIEGSYFEASNDEVKAYRQNPDSLAPGSEATYSIDLDDVSKEVGVKVNSFVVLPVQNSKACLNQRMIVIG